MPACTRANIQDAFLRLYRRGDMERLSVKALCQEAHVARTTFYAYYDGVHSVLREAEDRLIGDLFAINESFRATDFSIYRKGETFPFFRQTLDYIQDHLPWFQALLGRGEPRFLNEWKGIIKHHFREKYRVECIRLKHPELVLEMTVSAVLGAYTYWVTHADEVSAEDVGDEALPRIAFDFIS